jgi:hypothetical protein
MYIGPEMYSQVSDRDAARDLFAKTVDRVEMETHSYCNRRCSYCPNVVGDRLGANQHMPDDIWETIISNLQEIDYKKNLVLNYYNEPLADRAILERIREARSRVPKARIMIYSNGDYLDPQFIDELGEAGLNYLHISIHLKRGDEYSDIYVINRINEISVRMGIPAKVTNIKSREFIVAQAAHRVMEIEIRGINFQKHGTDRGGLIDDIATAAKRSAPCFFPFAHFVIGFSGLIAPCCHIRSDRPEHESYIYGNLRDYGSIFQAFMSTPAAAWRRELVGSQEKRRPCDTCSAGHLPNPRNLEDMAAAHQKYVVPLEAATAPG